MTCTDTQWVRYSESFPDVPEHAGDSESETDSP